MPFWNFFRNIVILLRDFFGMNTRLKLLRKTLDMNQETFAASLGIIHSTVSKYERGEMAPSAAFFAKLGTKHHVNLNWLFTGEGPMFIDESDKVEIESFDFDLLIDIVKKLSLKRQKMVMNYAEDQYELSMLINEKTR